MREDDPRQEHPELNISCPGLPPPPLRTKTSTVDRNLKRRKQKEMDGEKVKKREEISCSDSLQSVSWKIIKRK